LRAGVGVCGRGVLEERGASRKPSLAAFGVLCLRMAPRRRPAASPHQHPGEGGLQTGGRSPAAGVRGSDLPPEGGRGAMGQGRVPGSSVGMREWDRSGLGGFPWPGRARGGRRGPAAPRSPQPLCAGDPRVLSAAEFNKHTQSWVLNERLIRKRERKRIKDPRLSPPPVSRSPSPARSPPLSTSGHVGG